MPCEQLSEFLDRLVEQNQLVRVRAGVRADRELAAIVDRVAKSPGGAGPAVLFERVDDLPIPVVANLLGTEQRLLTALDTDSVDAIADRIAAVLKPNLPDGWLDAVQLVPRFLEAARWPVRETDTAASQQVVHMGRDVDLRRLPAPLGWPGESLPAITAGQVFLERVLEAPPHPADAASGVDPAGTETQTGAPPHRLRLGSRVPVQIRDRHSVLIRWTPQDEEWQVVADARRTGRQLPVAIALGGDPVLTFAVGVPLPAFVDPLVFAGFLRRDNVTVARARSVDLRVPAQADLILEGLIDPVPPVEDAPPFAAPTGFLADSGPAISATITAVTHRANPVLPVIVPARPPSEDAVLARAAQRILLPLVRLAVPELVDLNLPACGAHRHLAFVSLRKSYPAQARKVMHALWGLGRLSTVKLIVAVDAGVNVQDDQAVWSAVAAHAHPGRDTLFTDGPADRLDHASPVRGLGRRLGIDATAKLPDEGHPREWPAALAVDPETEGRLRERWLSFGLSGDRR